MDVHTSDAAIKGEIQEGYPKLAQLMNTYVDTAVFRRFSELNILNLLRLQAEINELEHQLTEIPKEDIDSDDPIRQSYSADFRAMREGIEEDSEQIDIITEISKKLQEYSRPAHSGMSLVA